MTAPIPDMIALGGATLLLSRMSRLLPEGDRDRKNAEQIIEQLDAFQRQLPAAIEAAERAAVAAFRERAAQVAETFDPGYALVGERIAARIRELS